MTSSDQSEMDSQRTEPPTPIPPTDGTAQSIVQGDKVGGDKITVGNMQNVTGAAIGPGAIVKVENVTIQHPISPEGRRNQRSHKVLRQAVKAFWIDGVLNHSLYNEVLIRLGMERRADAVDSLPWKITLGRLEQRDQPLPHGTRILDVFDVVGHQLLILGEPGSGKTTVLLELARDLIGRADADPTHATPVVFNLSSWAGRKQTLARWLVEELNIRYSIPKKVAQAWVQKDELLLLLDGLDEVKPESREECVEAINHFHQEHMVPLVICSRTAEYETISVKLKLQGAVSLQSLSFDQINAHLDRVGGDLTALRTSLDRYPDLREMARSPLLLNVMILAYQGVSTVAVTSLDFAGARYQHLFDAYIHRMLFEHREVKRLYTPHRTLCWLHWLAAHLFQHGQTIFLIEWMQPVWVKVTKYKGLTLSALMLLWGPLYGIVWGITLGMVFGLLAGLSSWLVEGSVAGLVAGLVVGLVFGQVFGLVVGLVGVLVTGSIKIRSVETSSWSWQILRSSLNSAFYWGVLYGLVGVLVGWQDWQDWLRFEMVFDLVGGLAGGLVGGLVGGSREIKLVKQSSWTRENLKRNLFWGLRFGLLVGLLVGPIFALVDGMLVGSFGGLVDGMFHRNDELLVGPVVGLVGGIAFGLIFEPNLRNNVSDAVSTQTPNQGIKLATKFALTTALVSGLLFGPMLGLVVELAKRLSFGLADELAATLVEGLMFSLLFGLVAGLIGGGDVVVKHFLLRLILYCQGNIPWNYAKFLDHSVERIFLRKVGGGYIFVHRLLMEHFAAMTEKDIERLAAEVLQHRQKLQT